MSSMKTEDKNVKLVSIIKNFFLDIIGDAIGCATVMVDHDLSSKEYRDRIKGYDNVLDAIADGKFGYSEDYEKLLHKYGRTFKGQKTTEQAKQKEQESNVFTRTKKNAWLYDSINESLRRQAESAKEYNCDEEPKSFKEKVQKAEVVDAEIIDP